MQLKSVGLISFYKSLFVASLLIHDFVLHFLDIELVNEIFKRSIKSLPHKFEYYLDSDFNYQSSYCIKIPIQNSNVKLTIVLMNWQKEFYKNILNIGGQPFTDSNNLIIRPQNSIVNERLVEWEVKLRKSINDFLSSFCHKFFDMYRQHYYDFDKLKKIGLRDSEKRIFLYMSRNKTIIHIMCLRKNSKFMNDIIKSCKKTKSKQSNAIEKLIDELKDINRDKNNPLYFLNQLIIDNFYKTKRSINDSILCEHEIQPFKKFNGSS